MKLTRILMSGLALTGLMTTAQAGDNNHKEIYGVIGISTNDYADVAGEAKIGYKFSKYFGVEGQASLWDENGISFNLAAFGTLRVPATNKIDVFSRLGYHVTSFRYDYYDYTYRRDDFAIGAGAQYNFSKKDGLRLDYTNYSSYESLALSYARKF